MSTLKVDGIRSNSASSDAITLASDGTCTANITNNLSNRNLIINGAMQVAQRGTSSSTDTNGYHTLDRFKPEWGNIDNAITQAQVDVASGTTPYTLGFRKCLKITNGNQTGGAGTASFIRISTTLEAQDLATSGWNYTSASSYITLSFWVKSSVAQNFYGRLYTYDGTSQNYAFETGSLSADTWTKVTKTIPGNSNITFDNNVNSGLNIEFGMFRGTDTTGSVSLNTWAAYASGTRTPDQTSTWYTTNDATLEITGVQLEVGSVATDFEHRSYAQELKLCERYFQTLSKSNVYLCTCTYFSSSVATGVLQLRTTMRTPPTLYQHTTTDGYLIYRNSSQETFNSFTDFDNPHQNGTGLYKSGLSGTAGHAGIMHLGQTSSIIAAQAEL